MRQGDRCYQGMTIAFDFSVEELWVPLIAGATLVPGKAGASLVGSDLADYLHEQPRHGHVLRADAAGHDRARSARAAHPAGVGRGLPAKPRHALASAGPHHPQCLWPDRGNRHRDADRALSGQARDHRRAAADLHHRHSRSGQGRGDCERRFRRDRHRRHRACGRLSQPRRPHAEEVHSRLSPDSRTTRPGASIAPATSAASTSRARSSSTAASTRRSRSAAIGSSSTEIESVLMQLPQIAQAVVNTYEVEPGAVELVAYYTSSRARRTLPHGEIAARCASICRPTWCRPISRSSPSSR